MDIGAIASLSAPAPVGGGARPETVAREFDRFLLEMLLRGSGAFENLGGGAASGQALGDLWVQTLANDLAAQLDLGIGRQLLAQMNQTQDRG